VPKLTVIIVNFNTKELLRDCLTNLEVVGLPDAKTVVVDNGSTDGSADMVAKEFKNVDLIRTENNGVAAGFNLAIKRSPDWDYYLFMGSDAFPKTGDLKGVIDFMEPRRDIGIAAVKLVLRSGLPDRDAHRGFPTPWTALTHFTKLDRLFSGSALFTRYFLGGRNMAEPHEIDLCTSHFMMVKGEVLKKVGSWDEDFFVYGEDVDFCWRVKQAGYKIFYLPQFECLHYKGASVGIRKESADITKADAATKSRMKAESVRAMRIFYRKHMYKNYPWIVNKLVEFGVVILSRSRAS
jgi:hypothetical protein